LRISINDMLAPRALVPVIVQRSSQGAGRRRGIGHASV
jgi:hypothetical protein